MRFCPSTSNQNILLAKLSEESSRKGAIAKSTNAKFTIWRHCKSCFSFIRFSNDWNLYSFSSDKKHTDSWAFCHAIEDSRLHAKSLKNNKKESVRAMLDNVSQLFMLVDRPDSRLNGDGKFAFLLQQQLWGYRASNIPEKHQVASSGSAL
jgi:hypothetical protein